jgi:hypothetical protein
VPQGRRRPAQRRRRDPVRSSPARDQQAAVPGHRRACPAIGVDGLRPGTVRGRPAVLPAGAARLPGGILPRPRREGNRRHDPAIDRARPLRRQPGHGPHRPVQPAPPGRPPGPLGTTGPGIARLRPAALAGELQLPGIAGGGSAGRQPAAYLQVSRVPEHAGAWPGRGRPARS